MRAASRLLRRFLTAAPGAPPSAAGSLVFEAEREIASLQQTVRESLAVHRLDDALSAAMACTSATESLFGRSHVAFAAALNNVAQVHRARGDAAAALPFAADALKTYEAVAGKDGASTAVARSNVGLLHVALAARVKGVARLEHARAAAELLDEALVLARAAAAAAAAGRNDSDARVAAVRVGVALCHAASAARLAPSTTAGAGGVSRAEALLRESVATLRTAAGPRAAVTATSLNNLGLVLKEQGKFDDACGEYAEALAVRRERLGAAHADAIVTAHNFAECRRAAGDEEGALELQREIIALTRADEEETPAAANTMQ
jgi:tetratricopeptide (TPR) repeat protein